MSGPVPTAAGTAFEAIVESAARSAAALAGEALAAFAAPSTGLDGSAVLGAQSALRPLLLAVLVTAVLVQSVRLVAARRGEPLAVLVSGLARFVLATTLGLAMLQAALVGGDALAAGLPGAPLAEVGGRLARQLTDRDGLTEPFLLLLASVCVLVLAAALWMALVVRQLALLVIAATLPLAAAGSLTVTTRDWLARLTPWAVALIVYKPAAALVLGLGAAHLIGPGAPQGVGGVLAGIVVLGLAVGVLPATLRLLSWTTVRVAGSLPAGRGGASAATGAVRLTGRVGGSAVALAGFLERSGPGAVGAARRPAAPLAPACGPVLPGTRRPDTAPLDPARPRPAGPGVAASTALSSPDPAGPSWAVPPPRAEVAR